MLDLVSQAFLANASLSSSDEIQIARDKSTTAEHATQRAVENAEQVAEEAAHGEDNLSNGLAGTDGTEGGHANRETPDIHESPQSASNHKSSDVEATN
jgi:hypothetical protein